MIYVTIYEVDRFYGGPEEGGWWYDYGQPILDHPLNKTFKDKKSANEYAYKIENDIAKENEGKHKPYSVLSNGDYREIHVENHPPKVYPIVKPHYE